MITTSFRKDLELIYDKLAARESFSFSKYADGEYKILVNQPITNCDGWTFIPERDKIEYKSLLDSFQYDHKDYYVGISCPCCQPQSHVDWMRDNVKSENITWANLFVNSNYEFFADKFFPEFNDWDDDVIFVGHKDGMDKELPFETNYYLPIDIGYWKEPYLSHIIETLSEVCVKKNGQLFLFSAGPLGNILAHQLHVKNPNNTYIDIGSTVNPWIVGNNRGYLNGKNLNKTCIW